MLNQNLQHEHYPTDQVKYYQALHLDEQAPSHEHGPRLLKPLKPWQSHLQGNSHPVLFFELGLRHQ